MSVQKQTEVTACSSLSEDLKPRMDVLIESKVEAINPTVARLMRILRKSCCNPQNEYAVETALREALANAILHGNRLDPKKKVRVCCGCDPSGAVLIVVKDEGAGFDPTRVPHPIEAGLLGTDHGRGIFLINQLMDQVRFARGGTELYMRKNGPASADKLDGLNPST